MEHSYRTLQQWNRWLEQDFLGKRLLQAEQEALTKLLKQHFGKHALLIGVPEQYDLLKSTTMPFHSIISPIFQHQHYLHYIEGDFHELPLLTGSVDVVLLPHTLEFIENPRQLLAEACRVIRPEGLIVICGFNPFSTWGIKKMLTKDHEAPWMGHFIQSSKVKSWLQLSDFKIESQSAALFSPPVTKPSLYEKFHFLESIGKKWCAGFGGAYVLIARAKVIPLTPIKMKWKQPLSGFKLPTTISGHILDNHR